MIKNFIILLLSVIIITGCGPRTQEEETDESVRTELTPGERGFLNNLASLCGQSFRGEQVYLAEGRDSWEDKELIMHVTVCEEDKVHIPFHVDDDHSRTWMFLVENGRLRLRHDHRYPDGTPHDVHLYGGYSDGKGTEFWQNFPVDEFSKREVLEDEHGREWMVVLDEDMTTYSYRLLYHGEIVLQADFDLTEPI